MAKTKEKQEGLSTFHLTMLALGTVVGGSFFLGSGVGIKAAGPSILISYILGGLLIYIILYALSEMTVADPVAGSFRTYAERSFGPAVGFITGWVYWTGLVFAMSSESIAATTFLRQWFPNLSPALMGASIIIGITLLNLLGAKYLSKLESSLAAVKLLAIAGFIAIGLAIIAGLMPGTPAIGAGELRGQPWFPGGIAGIAGSMLIVIFTYAGFEVIGLAASEVRNPKKTVPRAINLTLISLVGLYVAAIAVILLLFPTQGIIEDQSPFVLALNRWGMNWAGLLINIVMVTAILSTMLASTFGLGRMIRSLAAEGHAPGWLKEKTEVPYRGILFSGLAMLGGLGLGFLLPRHVYLFLISLGGFSLLFAYFVILGSHYKWRKRTPCSPEAACQLPGFPYTSWLGLIGMIGIFASMPFIPGQGAGLIAGLILVTALTGIYYLKTMLARHPSRAARFRVAPPARRIRPIHVPYAQMEASEEYAEKTRHEPMDKPKS
ncbi:amino acid permease [Paenibacillus puldeungensis]|uniref:Amino acid permease n=1 Tax=Paenibacillus puldeungensis TaxID=696536 RepID=A0ABW3S209_9BACL